MEFYKASIDENCDTMKKLLEEKKFPATEEISAKGHFWTPLHYSMHFGKWEVVKYLLEYFKNNNKLGPIMRLRSDDKRCPVLCLLKSNAIQTTTKKEIINKLIEFFPELYFSQAAINECVNKNIDGGVVKKIKHLQEKLKLDKANIDVEFKSLKSEEVREKLINNTLPYEKKTSIYKAITDNNVALFQSLVKSDDIVFEELSSKGYFWTSLHYAMHFGKEEIIMYIFKLLDDSKMLNLAMKLKSNDNRSPITCLVKSNTIESQQKIQLLSKIAEAYPNLYLDNDDKTELKERGFTFGNVQRRSSNLFHEPNLMSNRYH